MNSLSIQKKKIFLVAAAIGIIVLSLLYFVALPRIINIKKYKPVIEKNIKDSVAVPIKLGTLSTTLTWDLGVKIYIKSVDAKHTDGKDFITAGPVVIEVSIPALLQHKVLIREIDVNNPNANIARLENGIFDIESLIPKKTKPGKYKVVIKNTKIIVKDYQIHFKDKYFNPVQNLNLTGKQIKVLNLDPKKFIRVLAKGQIQSGTESATRYDINFSSKLPFKERKLQRNNIELKGTVSGLYPARYLVYINDLVSPKFSQLSGSANLSFNIKLKNSKKQKGKFYVGGVLKDFIASRDSKVIVNLPGISNIFIKGSYDKKDLNFKKAFISSKNARAGIEGSISDFRIKKRILNLKINIEKSRIESLIGLVPQEINIPKNRINKIRKYNLKGNVWGNFEIVGPYKHPSLFGKIDFNDISMLTDDPATPNGFGKVSFLGKVYDIDNVFYTNPHSFIKTMGTVAPFDLRTINLDVRSNIIDLGISHKMLLAIRDIIGFKIGPLTDMDVNGKGKISLNIKGKFNNVGLYGYVNLINAGGKYITLSKPAHNANGNIKFHQNKVIYDDIFGYVNNTKVIANGYSTLEGFSDVNLYIPKTDLKEGLQFINTSPLLIKVKQAIEVITDASGIGETKIHLKGTQKDLHTDGSLLIKEAMGTFKDISGQVKNVSGLVRFKDQAAYFDKLKGTAANSSATIEGSIIDKEIKMTLISPSLDLAEAKKIIKDSPALYKTQQAISDIRSITGYANTKIRLEGNVNEDFFKDVQFYIVKPVSVEYIELGFPAKLSSGDLLVTMDSLYTKNIQGSILDAPTRISGQVTGFNTPVIKPKIKVNINNFNFDKIRQLAQAPVVSPDIKKIAANFDNFSGQLNAHIDFLPSSYRINLGFDNAAARYKPGDIPVKFVNGRMIVTPASLSFKGFHSILSKSKIYLNGDIDKFVSNPALNLNAKARISAEDIEEYLNPYLQAPIEVKGTIPVAADIDGKLSNWHTFARMILTPENHLTYKDIDLSKEKLRAFRLDASGTKDKINVHNLEIAEAAGKTSEEFSRAKLKEANLSTILTASGTIDGIRSEYPVFEKFNIITPNPLDITLLNPAFKSENPLFSDGTFTANLFLQGKINSPSVTGNIILKGVTVPSKRTIVESGNISLNKEYAVVSNSKVNIAGSPARIEAVIDNSFETPILVRKIEIYSPSLDIDKISAAYRSPVKKTENGTQLPPFVVIYGSVGANELIISNLITSNFSSTFNFTPDWLLTMPNMSFETAGGTVTGSIIYNVDSSELSAHFIGKDMSANAAATTLFNLPNEVYGTLNGETEFTTKGNVSTELIANANGTASFRIVDGRLVRLGSLEYLLRAVNVAQSGIGGLNINNILDLIAPQKTGYFQVLDGTVTAKDGVLRTDNITSKGKNLSLFLSGNLDMLTNNANITIFGKLSKKVSGLLGPLGSLSINTFIGFIPGIGFLPQEPEKGLIDIIPGLSKIPVLGLGGGKYRRFVVKIEGDLYNPASVKSFRWVDK